MHQPSWIHSSFLNPPIVSLVRHPDVPLDVFDVLATPQSLHDCSHCKYLPLHEAASYGRTDLSQHLIKLGARVDQLDGFLKLPVMHFLEKNTGQFNDDLFRVLLPKRAPGKSILASIYRVLRMEENPKGTIMHMSEILHQLLQRLLQQGFECGDSASGFWLSCLLRSKWVSIRTTPVLDPSA